MDATFGAVFPFTATLTAAVTAAFNAVLPDIQARLAGAIRMGDKLALTPPSLVGSIQGATKLLSSLITMQGQVMPPSLNFGLAAIGATIAQLKGIIEIFEQAQAQLDVTRQSMDARVTLWVYEGPLEQFPAEAQGKFVGTFPVFIPILVVEADASDGVKRLMGLP